MPWERVKPEAVLVTKKFVSLVYGATVMVLRQKLMLRVSVRLTIGHVVTNGNKLVGSHCGPHPPIVLRCHPEGMGGIAVAWDDLRQEERYFRETKVRRFRVWL